MSDRDLILLAAAGTIGLMSALQTLVVLGLFEYWLASRRGEMPKDEDTVMFWQPSHSWMHRSNMYGVLVLFVFVLTSCLGLVAVRDSLGW